MNVFSPSVVVKRPVVASPVVCEVILPTVILFVVVLPLSVTLSSVKLFAPDWIETNDADIEPHSAICTSDPVIDPLMFKLPVIIALVVTMV